MEPKNQTGLPRFFPGALPRFTRIAARTGAARRNCKQAAPVDGWRLDILRFSGNRNGVAFDHGAPLYDCVVWAMFALAFSKHFSLSHDGVRFRPYRDFE